MQLGCNLSNHRRRRCNLLCARREVADPLIDIIHNLHQIFRAFHQPRHRLHDLVLFLLLSSAAPPADVAERLNLLRHDRKAFANLPARAASMEAFSDSRLVFAATFVIFSLLPPSCSKSSVISPNDFFISSQKSTTSTIAILMFVLSSALLLLPSIISSMEAFKVLNSPFASATIALIVSFLCAISSFFFSTSHEISCTRSFSASARFLI